MLKPILEKRSFNIIEFLQHPALLNDRSHSKTQVTVLKSIYGLPLTQEELDIHFRGTGKPYDAQEQREATLIAGRRAGKTGKVAAPIVVYESFRDHGLPKNEEAFVMLMAPTLKQAAIALKHIKNYIRGSKVLAACIVSSTRSELKLNNGVTISCLPRAHESVRGRTVIVAVLDEIAFWVDGADSADSVEQVIDALRPAMITARGSKLLKLSTPWGKTGVLFRDFSHRAELDFPVWQLPTSRMNPTVSSEVLEKEFYRDEEKFRREFQAEFTDTIQTWIASEVLDPCIVAGRSELPFHPGRTYAAALDPASRRNDFTLAIVHKGPGEKIVVDKIARWSGTTATPLAFVPVLAEVKDILTGYEINSACGDQFYCDAIGQHLRSLGIEYQVLIFNSHTRAGLFSNLKHLLAQGRIELLDEADLLRQLRNLRQEQTSRGQIDVRPSPGMNDDLAVAVALAANQLCKQSAALPTPFEIPNQNSLRLVPALCTYQAICENFPTCMDEDLCMGFKRNDLGRHSTNGER